MHVQEIPQRLRITLAQVHILQQREGILQAATAMLDTLQTNVSAQAACLAFRAMHGCTHLSSFDCLHLAVKVHLHGIYC